MNILRKINNFITSKSVTTVLLNIIFVLIIGALLIVNKPIWGSVIGTLWAVCKPFIFGFIIAFVLNSLINKVQKHVKNRAVSVAIVYITVIALVLLIIGLSVPSLYQSISELIPSFEGGLKEIGEFMIERFDFDISSLTLYIQQTINNFLNDGQVINTTVDVLSELLNKAVNASVYVILGIYFSTNYDSIRSKINKVAIRLSPHLPSYLIQIEYSLSQYLLAFMIGALVQMGMVAAMYLVIGQSNWLILALLAAISCAVPYIGPIVVNVLGVIVSLPLGVTPVIILLVLIFVQSTLMSYVITPKIYSSQIDLSVLSVLFGIITGSMLFGVWGVVISMPLIVCLKIAFKIYNEHRQFNKRSSKLHS